MSNYAEELNNVDNETDQSEGEMRVKGGGPPLEPTETAMLDEHKERVSAATVHLPELGGLGVLVPGGIVLTAAHCIDSYNSGGMALGDHCVETVEPRDGSSFRLSVGSVEPVADIAALVEADNQVFYDDSEVFEAFRENVRPVRVSTKEFAQNVPVRVHVLTHTGAWIEATATRYGLFDSGCVFLKANGRIEGGTSGGPVIDDSGDLVGVVSSSSEDEDRRGGWSGMIPRPHLTLPLWVWRRIEAESDDMESPRQPDDVKGEHRA